MAIKIPSKVTLAKYGLNEIEWTYILACQGNVCPICKKQPDSGRFVTDHYHVKGFKKMKPEEKKIWVRGITCWFCNRYFLARGVTVEKLKNAVEYLEKHERSKDGKR